MLDETREDGRNDASGSQPAWHSGSGANSRAEPCAVTGTNAASESELESHDLMAGG
jgi:hypothetical protein